MKLVAGSTPTLYRSGTMGPADDFITADGRSWIDPYDD